jgi:hypothetical protein
MNASSRPATPAPLPFDRFAGACAIAVAAGGVVYGIAFVVTVKSGPKWAATLSDLLLLVGGLLATAVFTALYGRLRVVDPMLALWGLVLGLAASIGSAIHGGFDLAVVVKPPGQQWNFPDAVDPRGLMTFGVTAIALAVFGFLIRRSGRFPAGIGMLAYAAAVLLIVVYLGRMIILNPKNPVLLAAAVTVGFVVSPWLYGWIGLTLWRGSEAAEEPAAG